MRLIIKRSDIKAINRKAIKEELLSKVEHMEIIIEIALKCKMTIVDILELALLQLEDDNDYELFDIDVICQYCNTKLHSGFSHSMNFPSHGICKPCLKREIASIAKDMTKRSKK